MLTLCHANWKGRVEFVSPRRTRRARRHEGKGPSLWSLCSLWLNTALIRLPSSLPLSVSSVKSVVQMSGCEICPGHGQSRPVTVIIDGKASVHPKTPGGASASALTKSEKCEKSEKSVFQISQLETAVAQFVPNKIGGWVFSDFPKNFRGYMWGV